MAISVGPGSAETHGANFQIRWAGFDLAETAVRGVAAMRSAGAGSVKQGFCLSGPLHPHVHRVSWGQPASRSVLHAVSFKLQQVVAWSSEPQKSRCVPWKIEEMGLHQSQVGRMSPKQAAAAWSGPLKLKVGQSQPSLHHASFTVMHPAVKEPVRPSATRVIQNLTI